MLNTETLSKMSDKERSEYEDALLQASKANEFLASLKAIKAEAVSTIGPPPSFASTPTRQEMKEWNALFTRLMYATRKPDEILNVVNNRINREKTEREKEERERKEKERADALKIKTERAVNFLIQRGKVLGRDFSIENAIDVANNIRYNEEVAAKTKEMEELGDVIDFVGMNCDDCPGWNGVDRRCACGNRRVYWESYDSDFESEYYCLVAVAW
jgi:hypothetical protein